MILKCISLWQPWASAMALGLKRNETRGWATKYRGLLGIHAAKRVGGDCAAFFLTLRRMNAVIDSAFHEAKTPYFTQLPRGCVLAVGTLVDVVPVKSIRAGISPEEMLLGDYRGGRFAWVFKDLRALATPIPARGAQGFFNVELPDGIA